MQPSSDASEDGERKIVTALFADIKGSMELMEDLDPEEARAIVDPALKLMIEAVHRYDGYVVQSTGTASSHCSALPLRTRTIHNVRCTRRYACRSSSAGIPISSAATDDCRYRRGPVSTPAK